MNRRWKVGLLVFLLGGLAVGASLWAWHRLGSGQEVSVAEPARESGHEHEQETPPREAPKGPCYPGFANGRFIAQAEEWNAFVRKLSSASPENLVEEINRYRDRVGLPQRMGQPDPERLEGGMEAYQKKWPDRFDEDEGTGNPGTYIFVKKLDDSLVIDSRTGPSADLVIEFDPQDPSKELRRWKVPLEAAPEALRGDSLLTELEVGTMCSPDQAKSRAFPVWMSYQPDGTFSAVLPPPTLPLIEGSGENCPTSNSFMGSDYTTCGRFQDVDSGATRLLLWQSSMT